MNPKHMKSLDNMFKLAEARKIGRARKSNEWHKEHRDDFDRLLAKTKYRQQHGLPLE